MIPLLAVLVAPFGAVVLSLLLALAACYAAAYAGLHQRLWRQSNPGHADEDLKLEKVVKAVNMLGLHVEDIPGCDVITIKDQQNAHQQAVMQFFALHGYRNSNVYTTYSNPEMQVLLLPGVGCMVYTTCQHWGLKAVIAVGDPVCDPKHDLVMLRTFRAVFPDGALMDVSKEVASLWAEEEDKQPGPSMTVTDSGTETIIDVQKYDFEFNKRTKEIRRNAEAATRAGLYVEEVTAHSSAAVKEQVQQLAAEWQQGKEVTDDLKVFSRIIPFQHLGREKDVRVFIARTLEPGEAAPFTVAMAAQQLEQQKAAAAAKLAAKSVAMTEDDGSTIPAAAPRSSEQQRKKRERRALARQQRQQQQQCTIDCAPSSPPPPSAAASDTDIPDHIIVACDTELLPGPHEHQQQKQKQQETAVSSSSDSSSNSSDSGGSGEIHACVMLDPIYRDGEVVGYFVQRTFLSPRGPKGAPKLVLKEVMSLLKAEGRSILNHGPAAAHNVKPGAYHGFMDCTWLRRSLQLCWEYGNSLYAFRNLAMAKSSWGGGYCPEGDSLKYKEAVTLNRRFVLLPPSWRCQLGHGPLMMLVVFRHVGVLGDPWELFAFWRYW